MQLFNCIIKRLGTVKTPKHIDIMFRGFSQRSFALFYVLISLARTVSVRDIGDYVSREAGKDGVPVMELDAGTIRGSEMRLTADYLTDCLVAKHWSYHGIAWSSALAIRAGLYISNRNL